MFAAFAVLVSVLQSSLGSIVLVDAVLCKGHFSTILRGGTGPSTRAKLYDGSGKFYKRNGIHEHVLYLRS